MSAGRNRASLSALRISVFLRRNAGRRQPVAGAVLVHGGTADDRENRIPIPHGVLQAFQDDNAATFAAHVTVRGGIKRPASAVRRQHAGFRKRDARPRRQNQVHAGRHRKFALAGSQASDRLMNRNQRG